MGLIHVYHGNGKGKTTCALGLALRASGAGMKVCIIQFLKGSETSELKALKALPNVTILRNSEDFGFVSSMTHHQLELVKAMHNENLSKALELINNGKCDLLILDEVTYVYDMNLIDTQKIDTLLTETQHPEIVITGRDPNKIFLENADYITEMKAVRHPFDNGINARKGIEY